MNDDDELTQALAAVAGSPGASGSALFEQSTASASGDNGAVNMVTPQKKVKQNFVTKKGYYIHVQSRSPNSHAGSDLIQVRKVSGYSADTYSESYPSLTKKRLMKAKIV